MKVVFLQRDSFVKLGVEQLSAVLKRAGHKTDLFIETGETRFLETALGSRADLFAFSCTTGQENWVRKTAAELKLQSGTPIIIGGPHATFFPRIIEDPNVDYICVGEGEEAVIELLDTMADGRSNATNVRNIWSKDLSGAIHKTELRPLIQDLDEIPSPDFGIYAKYKYIASYGRDMFSVITSRGCPYNCSYCFNNIYRDLYRNKGKYLRRRSPGNVIAELDEAKKRYGARKLNFVDDSFFIFPAWLREFAPLYKKKVDLPFIINVEATQVEEWMVRLIEEMGCICVRMGVESGDDHLREVVLNKKVRSEQIRAAAAHIKAYGIQLATYNILGLPGETVENALKTYTLNREIGTNFAWCSLLQPYPGTAISKYIKEKGFLKADKREAVLKESYFVSSSLHLENEKEITNLQKLMQIFLQMKVPLFLVRRMIKLPQNPLFRLIFKVSFVYSKIRTQRIRLVPLARLAVHSFSYMSRRPTGG